MESKLKLVLVSHTAGALRLSGISYWKAGMSKLKGDLMLFYCSKVHLQEQPSSILRVLFSEKNLSWIVNSLFFVLKGRTITSGKWE